MRDARLDGVTFGDDDYSFRLGYGEFVELQEKTGCGPFFLLNRMQQGGWMVEDVSNTIRLGLIGAGMEPVKAKKLVKRYVEDRPPLENVELAVIILTAGLLGAPEEPLGEPVAASQPTNFQTEGSGLPQSME